MVPARIFVSGSSLTSAVYPRSEEATKSARPACAEARCLYISGLMLICFHLRAASQWQLWLRVLAESTKLLYKLLRLRGKGTALALLSLVRIEPLSWLGIFCCLVSGTIVGLERQLLGKPVGIRTSSLICLGTYVFIVIANSVLNEHGDASRVIGQVITGIGFLGAGVMLTRDGVVMG